MEKEQYAEGDQVYIKGSYPGRCANVFVTLDRPASSRDGYDEGTWWVDYANRNYPVHERFFEFKSIPKGAEPRFKRGDRVLSKCPGRATFNQTGTVEGLSAVNGSGELYDVRLDTGNTHRINLGWLLPAPKEGPTYIKGDKVEITTSWDKGTLATVEAYLGENEFGELYRVRYNNGERHNYSIQFLKDAPELPSPRFKVGDKVNYDKGLYSFRGFVKMISDLPNKEGTYVYLVEDDVEEVQRWCADAFLEPVEVEVEVPEWFKDQLQPGDRVKFKFGRQCGEVVRIDAKSFPVERYVVKWDHSGKTYVESRRALEILYAPRTTDDPLPAQAEIDRVDKLREPIIKQVEELQRQLGELNKIKSKLKQL